jgi:hypothetical protein
LKWLKGFLLDYCLDNFNEDTSARQASKAAMLGAILLQQCDYGEVENVAFVNRIVDVLLIPQYHYVLKSYIDAYCRPKMTDAGKNLLNLLESCGVDAEKFF